MIDTQNTPTHVALVARRLNSVGLSASADTFLYASYLAEIAVKSVAVALHAGLREGSPEEAYRLGYGLVRADGFGNWDTAIRQCINNPSAATLPASYQPLVQWLTKKRTKPEDDWFRQSREAILGIFRELSNDDDSVEKISSARDMVTALVRIRNKTKAHGAVGQDFFALNNEHYVFAVQSFLSCCPLFSWQWLHCEITDRGVKVKQLSGGDPTPTQDLAHIRFSDQLTGLYVLPNASHVAYYCGELVTVNIECTNFLFPNGGIDAKGRAEYVDYASGKTAKLAVDAFTAPPLPLPPSETQGLSMLDVQSNVFGNLPQVPKGYVQRKNLQRQLEGRLLDRNHAVITLHGRGGVGKTSLALFVAHKLSSVAAPHFDHIVWFSARDIDLRPSGPKRVRPAVLDLTAISKAYCDLFNEKGDVEYFAQVLQVSSSDTEKGTLFIFDNFETLTDVKGIHEFLDTYTILPNKVLITSRERAFKADYPIEVRGMELDEATEMLKGVARDLHVEGLITEKMIRDIYDYAEGHAYVMRVLLGEIAKEGRYVPAPQVITRRLDIVDAVFERSFNKLTDVGRYVFLTVSNWKSPVSELALLVVIGLRGLEVTDGIEECLRLSLVTEEYLADGQPCYTAPQLARVFGRKKLEGDPDRLLIQEDLETIRRFGVIDAQRQARQTQEDLIIQFVDWCKSNHDAGENRDQIARLDRILETVAGFWPQAWLDVADFRRRAGYPQRDVEYAFRRAVEEMPFKKEVWLERARYAKSVGDEPTMITSLVSSVDADPRDVELISDVSYQLCGYIDKHKHDIPRTRRGVYLASVRSHMERVAEDLDATGLSRLAWLFLLEDDKANAFKYASLGINKDFENKYCANILRRLELDGYPPSSDAVAKKSRRR
ncbi:MAG: NB-ARC domain-containing protein [Anaerolineae bacterium]